MKTYLLQKISKDIETIEDHGEDLPQRKSNLRIVRIDVHQEKDKGLAEITTTHMEATHRGQRVHRVIMLTRDNQRHKGETHGKITRKTRTKRGLGRHRVALVKAKARTIAYLRTDKGT